MQGAQLEVSAGVPEFVRQRTRLARVERRIDGPFLRRLQREAKQVRGWSARVTAQHLGVTRATLKGMQSGKKSIGEMPQIHARNLQRELRKDRAEQGQQDRELLAVRFAGGWDARMRALDIERKPKKCDGCGRWFVPVSSRQKRHNKKECRMRAAQRARRSAKKGKGDGR